VATTYQKLLPRRGRTFINRRDGVLLGGPGVPGEGQEPANQQGTSGMHRLSPLCAHSLGRGLRLLEQFEQLYLARGGPRRGRDALN